MLRGVGLPRSALTGDLDGLYAEQLLRFVRASSLDAAVILAQDEPRRDDGSIIEGAGSFYVPNSFVLRLAREHPEFLPAVSIHPARRDALDELERCLAEGAVMLKCLPNCQNIDWNDRRYTGFLERMAESGLILLAHTGSERTLPVIAPRLADPRVLTRALEVGVTCIAAHSGTGTMLVDPDYFEVFAEMTRRFPRLYGDNSALAAANFRLRPSALQRLLEPELAARILHGSDVPVPVTGAVLWALGMLSWRTRWSATRRSSARSVLARTRLRGWPDCCGNGIRPDATRRRRNRRYCARRARSQDRHCGARPQRDARAVHG